MEIDREIKSLEEKLADVASWEKRVKELDGLLGAGGITSSASNEC
jgi:ATP-binding cassette subfamily D (ALD) long-chain fatty acid import protein